MRGANATRIEDEECAWQRAHRALSRLAGERAAADADEGRWLLAAQRTAAHVHLGFGNFGEYVERLFGYTRRTIQEKLRVAQALEELPVLSRALDTGSLGWSAARELTRVAVAETEQQWLDLSRGKTLRQLEELVAGKHPGDEPTALGLPSAKRHVLRFEVEPETFALFREALTSLRRRSGEALNDDSALLSMARHVLGGPKDDGRASYQISLSVCAACGGGQQHASGELVPVGTDVIAMAHCDGQHLGPIHTRAANENASPDPTAHAIETPVGRTTLPSPDPHAAGAHPADARAAAPQAADAHPSTRALRRDAPVGARAKQTLPPALRRAVLLRDQRRCRVPGCRNATFVDLHHIELRSEGGRHELGNVLTLCGAHHRAVHRGELVLERDAPEDVRFRHADGSEYGQLLQPQALGTQPKVFSALRQLGFAERDVRAVLAELQKDDTLRGASVEQLLRESLRKIRLPRMRR